MVAGQATGPLVAAGLQVNAVEPRATFLVWRTVVGDPAAPPTPFR